MLQDHLLRNKDLAALAPAFREIEERLRALEAAVKVPPNDKPKPQPPEGEARD